MSAEAWLSIVNTAAILASAVIAVVITLWWQERKEKRDAKIRLFTTLMAYRKSYPVSYEWAQSLNLIDVVFADSPKVLDRWHKYFDNLEDKNPAAVNRRVHIYLELMSEMAKELKFSNLQQTDIDKFYVPQLHGDWANMQAEINTEWLRVLKASARFEVLPRTGTKQTQSPPTPIMLRELPELPRGDEPPPAR
jgi:hypothetical protein